MHTFPGIFVVGGGKTPGGAEACLKVPMSEEDEKIKRGSRRLSGREEPGEISQGEPLPTNSPRRGAHRHGGVSLWGNWGKKESASGGETDQMTYRGVV